MSGVIHGKSHEALKYMREKPAALSVYWDYVARANVDNVAWPSIAALSKDTDWCKDTCQDARQWLVECGALEPVHGYVRREWRNRDPKELHQLQNLDRAEYYRPTGHLVINGKQYDMLYHAVNQESEEKTNKEAPDILPGRTSDKENEVRCPMASDVRPDRTELDTRSVSSNEETKHGFTVGETVFVVEEDSKTYLVTVYEGKVKRFTPKRVIVACDVDGQEKEFQRKANGVYRERPKLLRNTNEMEDVILEYSYNVTPDKPIGKNMRETIGRVHKQMMQIYPKLTPELLRAAYKWKGQYIPKTEILIISMPGDYRKHLAAQQPNRYAQPSGKIIDTAPTIDPHCPICGGTGKLALDVPEYDPAHGQTTPCYQCVKGGATNEQRKLTA